MKRFRLILILLVSLVVGTLVAYATNYITQYDTNYDGTDEYSLDVDGNIVTTGNGTVGGTLTQTGVATFTARPVFNGGINIPQIGATDYGVAISTSTTSVLALKWGGVYAAVPSTGFTEGTIIYESTNHHLYVSTDTVTGADDWVQLDN